MGTTVLEYSASKEQEAGRMRKKGEICEDSQRERTKDNLWWPVQTGLVPITSESPGEPWPAQCSALPVGDAVLRVPQPEQPDGHTVVFSLTVFKVREKTIFE